MTLLTRSRFCLTSQRLFSSPEIWLWLDLSKVTVNLRNILNVFSRFKIRATFETRNIFKSHLIDNFFLSSTDDVLEKTNFSKIDSATKTANRDDDHFNYSKRWQKLILNPANFISKRMFIKHILDKLKSCDRILKV